MRSETIINAVKMRKEVRQKGKFSVPVIVDKSLNYERHSWIIKIVRIPIIFILNMLPSSWGKIVFTAFCNHKNDSSRVRRWATTFRALEIIYTFPLRRAKSETNFMDAFWELFLNNARSVRNRLKLVEHELLTILKEVRRRKSQLNLMSLGSGSSRAVIEVLAQLNGLFSVRVKSIDISRGAINFSRELAATYNVNQIEWYRDYAQNLEKYCDDFQPDIIEMVGLLDYYPDKQAIDLLKKIYKVLSPGGWLITSNIRSNFERPFVTKAINWPMIYRSPEELATILIEAGFRVEHLKIIYEPLKIHGIIIAQKLV